LPKDRSPRRRPETTARYGRKPRRALRPGLRWLLALLPVLLVAGGTYVALRSPLLTVQEVRVKGALTLDQASLVEVSGLEGGSMLSLPTRDARQRLLSIPTVRSVKFERSWPSTVTIRIEERIGVAFWSVGGRDYSVDSEGVVLVGSAPNGSGPRILEAGVDRIMGPGDRVHPDAVALALRITDEAPRFLGQSVDLLEYRAGVGITAVFQGGLRVTFGDERSWEYKVAVLSELLDELMAQGVRPHAVDLRFGERVTYE
jgi:cell division protein FtsQ